MTDFAFSDVLHPNRANVSKDELRSKLAEVYKSNKDQISVFGFRTQFGGGKSTGFALVYDSVEALKKFEPHYRQVRIGHANKIEKASRQQRKFTFSCSICMKRWQAAILAWLCYLNPAISGAEINTDILSTNLQANNERTDRRSSGERPRPREQRRTRNKQVVASFSGEGSCGSQRLRRWQWSLLHRYHGVIHIKQSILAVSSTLRHCLTQFLSRTWQGMDAVEWVGVPPAQ